MALQKQVHIYNFDTDAFYNEKEYILHKRLSKMYLFRSKLKKRIDKLDCNTEESTKLRTCLSNLNKHIAKVKKELKTELGNNTYTRSLREEYVNDRNIISIFESSLTRAVGTETDTLSDEIMVIRTYYFQVLEDLIMDGFIYNNEKYVYLTSSAGQIRTKKSVFIKEKTFLKHQNTLMCGLSVDRINELGGVNINKYLAYLALCNSATDVWEGFNIDKAIVVDDMEAIVNGTVDYIDHKTYKITRQEMDVPISHTDGCGMMLAKKYNKNMMVRLPWVKGLLSPFPFDKFISEKRRETDDYGIGKVVDIYGKEYDVLEDGIEIIFTKSQFKMWKYYPNEFDKNGNIKRYGWDIYKENFKKYNCQASVCNVEPDYFSETKIGYQMLQTLIDVTDEELNSLCNKTIKSVTSVGTDRATMLKLLGVTKANTNKNYLQQAIELYPELLQDEYCKRVLKQVKKSRVRQGRAGKIDVDGKYTFIIPDLYAFCEYLFLGITNPKGLLEDEEVYCKLYEGVEKLDCLRSPHLYREHGVRRNIVDDKKKKWFITNGLYISSHDLISKILQCDFDGDTSLVVADELFVKIAERNMKDIVPLYYEMANAGIEQVNNKSIYKGLTTAYTGGNIGVISNDITKIWNSDNINLDVIKWLCMENNFVID